MKRTFIILLFVIAAALFFISLFSLFIVSTSLEKRMLDASVTISSNKGGFDVNQSALTFGIVTPGAALQELFQLIIHILFRLYCAYRLQGR